MASPQKQEVITFKVDGTLAEALNHVQNRSEFIRQALLMALDNHCPLCNGTGVLTPHQKGHWEELMKNHELELCDSCHEYHLICKAGEKNER